MPYKTPNRTSEYLREIMGQESDPILASIISEADELHIPILLPEAAAFVRQLVRIKNPRSVLEIGTAIGYSGCLFLGNCACKLTTIDKNADYLVKARQIFHKCGFSDRCRILEGDADEIVPTLDDCFDLIFLDGPKTKYKKYLPHLKRMLASGGILLADNVLFNGMVAGETPTEPKKKNIVSSLDTFLRELYTDVEFITSVLNVGDGMSLSIKL